MNSVLQVLLVVLSLILARSDASAKLNCLTTSATCNELAAEFSDNIAFKDVCYLVDPNTNQYEACKDICDRYYDEDVAERYKTICDAHCSCKCICQALLLI